MSDQTQDHAIMSVIAPTDKRWTIWTYGERADFSSADAADRYYQDCERWCPRDHITLIDNRTGRPASPSQLLTDRG